MKPASLKGFFGKSATKTESQQNVNKAKPTPTGTTGPVENIDIEKELIGEIKQNETSETISAGQSTSATAEKGGATVKEEEKGAVSGSAENNFGAPVPTTFQVVIGGKMLLYGCDAVFPRMIIWGAKQAGYKTDKKIADFLLTEDEIKMLEPSADLISQELFSKLSPMVQFCGMLTMVYAKKL